MKLKKEAKVDETEEKTSEAEETSAEAEAKRRKVTEMHVC